MSFIEIDHITHCYQGGQKALDGVTYRIEQGEFFSLLGPSGCGKSTLLNIIGGFLTPTSGSITVDGADILSLPPYKRKISTVFQSYALFPHMSVFENVAFGLRVQKESKAAIAERVGECLALVHLEGYEKRMPHQLSGGQQQRVAIARALANRPSILLLDEPMGNLDAKLRKEMQVELRAIQQQAGVTAIMVTHDQEEAMSMSDHMGIMRAGVVQQAGSPYDLYAHPANSFVAGFLGKVNLTKAKAAASGHGLVSTEWESAPGKPVAFPAPQQADLANEGGTVCVALRPESINVSHEPQEGTIPATIASVVYVGGSVVVDATLHGAGDLQLELSTHGIATLPKQGDVLYLSWPDNSAVCVKDVG